MSAHVCCVGFDPRLSDIPKTLVMQNNVKRTLVDFFTLVLECTPEISATKINFAFFEQYGLEGWEALKECMNIARGLGKFIIADAKRGDIDISNEAYVQSLAHVWGADAATFHPWLGPNTFETLKNVSLRPYFLIKTSNKDSTIIQNVSVQSEHSEPLFLYCLSAFLNEFPEGGFVVGATDVRALDAIAERLKECNARPFMLLPGVGRQGGDAQTLIQCLKPLYGKEWLQKILVPISSGIIYAAPSSTTSVQEVRSAISSAAQHYVRILGG